MNRLVVLALLWLSWGWLALGHAAAPIATTDIPAPLASWVGWVLYDQEDARCPFLYNQVDQPHCHWPGPLELELETTHGEFHQHWQILTAGWVALPGDAQRWPQSVSQNGQALLVGEDANGRPQVYLEPGQYQLSGHWRWSHLPEALQLPTNTGLVQLVVNSQPLPFPDLDATGKLWLSQRPTTGDKPIENRLDLRVYRQLQDGIPFTLTTRIQLEVAGQPRELVLGQRLVDAQWLPLRLESQLPARLEADGRIRLQVRPGRWHVSLTTRSISPVTQLTSPTPQVPWPEEEIWVFAAATALRLVEIEGATRMDPQQTDLIPEWRHYPAYRLLPGESLQLVEKKRGDPDPGPDELRLSRQLWLDFSGQGYTLHDEITGTVRRSWRLEMQPELQLGRVSINGLPQLITQQPQSPDTGVEIRQGNLNLAADSRLPGQIQTIPAVGWAYPFQHLDMTLNLPPGWRLLHAGGADQVGDTWLQRWSLLDLFLVLIIAIAFAKLWRWYWGLFALITLVLIYHESLAPHWAWLNALAAIALLRLLPAGRLQTGLRHYRNLSVLALALVSVAFMADQARKGLYPQLEQPWNSVALPDSAEPAARMSYPASSPASVEEAMVQDDLQPNAPPPLYQQNNIAAPQEAPTYSKQKQHPSRHQYPSSSVAKKQVLLQYDEKANIQTGPGLQNWEWNRITLGWSGPVAQDQRVQLYLLTPQQNLWLNFLRIPLLALLLGCLFEIPLKRQPLGKQWGKKALALGLLLGLTSLTTAFYPPPLWAGGTTPSTQPNALPDPAILQQLQERLLPPPSCAPNCASSPYLRVETSPDQLRLIWQVHSLAATVVPLPAHTQHWLPQWVFVDGEAATGLQRNAEGQLLLPLSTGDHQIYLEGQLPERATIQIPFALRPHTIETQMQGWTLEGLDEQQQAQHIQLTRVSKNQSTTLEAGTLPAFVQVERTLSLGLTWQVETQVTRLSPGGSAVVLEIPVLVGESVTSEGVRVNQGLVQVSLSAQQNQFGWTSVFNQQPTLVLQAPATQQWTEVWKLNSGPIWHVTLAGIPVIHHQNSEGEWLPEWRPWPGERVELHITRPLGIEGQTLTLDYSQLDLTPGQRATEWVLKTRLRSSQGGQHTLTLPPQAELRSVKINGQSHPIRQDQRKVVLPLVPGQQTVELNFWDNQGLTTHFRSAAVDLGAPSVNSHVHLHLPERWILWVKGPVWGPAILFWGVLLVIVLLSLVLARVPFLPLRSHEWLLLGLGLTQADMTVALMVLLWFFALGKRQTQAPLQSRWLFNLTQLALAGLTLLAIFALMTAIQQGLLGQPDMHIAGNQSTANLLRWFEDRVSGVLPEIQVISMPLLVYRGVMLLWALWLAFACLRWMRWGWQCFSHEAIWRSAPLLKTTATHDIKPK